MFLWLTGIRAGAFVSLPLKAVDLDNLEIRVFPSLGVRVKNKKGRIVYIPDFPELMAVVREWDSRIKEKLPGNGLWFAPLLPQTGELDLNKTIETIGGNRYRMLQRNSREWMNKAGLEYHSPHKFRHGSAVNGMKHARTVEEMKAVSQNLGHSSLVTTDSIYGEFYNQDVKETISRMGRSNPGALGDVSENDLKMAMEIVQLMRSKLT